MQDPHPQRVTQHSKAQSQAAYLGYEEKDRHVCRARRVDGFNRVGVVYTERRPPVGLACRAERYEVWENDYPH